MTDTAALVERLTPAKINAIAEEHAEKIARFTHSTVTGGIQAAIADVLDAIAALADAPVPPATPHYENLWIVTEYKGGGIRGLFTSQADAEAWIADIRVEYPDLTRSDFVVEVHRIRRAVPPATEGETAKALVAAGWDDGVRFAGELLNGKVTPNPVARRACILRVLRAALAAPVPALREQEELAEALVLWADQLASEGRDGPYQVMRKAAKLLRVRSFTPEGT